MNDKTDNMIMYRQFEIAEWNQKCCVISVEEKLGIMKCLREGTNSPLLELMRLPFPKFAESYFRDCPVAKGYLKDPAFGYKLYFLSDNALKIFCERLRNPEITFKEMNTKYGLSKKDCYNEELMLLQIADYESFSKMMTGKGTLRLFQIKYLYLSQYIDLEESRRLGLSMTDWFESEGADGYEIDKKLESFNPTVRMIMTLYLGLYGQPRLSTKDISNKLGLSVTKTNEVINTLMPYFFHSTGVLRHSIGYVEQDRPIDEMKEYNNKNYRTLDIAVETQFRYSRMSDEAKLVLSTYSNKELTLYLAAKFMFKTPESLAKNMTLSTKDAERLLISMK